MPPGKLGLVAGVQPASIHECRRWVLFIHARQLLLPGRSSMRIQFSCPVCHQPLSVASHFAGRGIACPTCREYLAIPTESSRQTGDAVAADTAPNTLPPSSRRRRQVVLASVLLALIFGLCAVVASSISGKNSNTQRAHADPAGQPHGEPDTAVVAELDKLASEEEALTETEVVSPEPPETAKPIEPPVLTHS